MSESQTESETERFGSGLDLLDGLRYHWDIITKDLKGKVSLFIVFVFAVIAVFGPSISPHGTERLRGDAGQLLSNHPPTLQYPFGTNWVGQDMFSMSLIAVRTDLIIGAVTAIVVVLIGANVGLISGYYGGKTDSILMRITDIVYGVPLEPFAIVFITLTDASIGFIILSISLILWRTVARVIRSEVLSIKTRTFVAVAQDRGIPNYRIIYRHIVPNIYPILLLYVAISISLGIVFNAGISFLGFGDPNRLSLGGLMYESWTSGVWAFAPWGIIFPGLLIFLIVVSVFIIGQAYEEQANPRIREF